MKEQKETRTERIEIRCTPAEKKEITRIAKKNKISVSRFAVMKSLS